MMLCEISEIKEADVKGANKLLKKSFELIKQPVKMLKDGEEKIIYVLAK